MRRTHVLLPTQVTATGFLGDRLALGSTLATATMIGAIGWCAMLCVAFSIPRLYSPRTYVVFLALSSFGIVLVFGLPVHVVDFLSRRQPTDIPTHESWKQFNCVRRTPHSDSMRAHWLRLSSDGALP